MIELHRLYTPAIVPHKIGAVETTSTTIPAYFLPSLRMPGKRGLFSQGIYKFTCNQEGLLRVTNFILCHSFYKVACNVVTEFSI